MRGLLVNPVIYILRYWQGHSWHCTLHDSLNKFHWLLFIGKSSLDIAVVILDFFFCRTLDYVDVFQHFSILYESYPILSQYLYIFFLTGS